MSFYDPFDVEAPVSIPPESVGPGPRPGWKLRSLRDDFPEEPRARLAPGEVPPEIAHLAKLLEVTPEFIMRNPRSYTPPTAPASMDAVGSLDPDKFND